jgi:group I intron endonuclease
MTYGVIYKITNSINDKVYYGQTKSNPPNARWNRHKYSARTGVKSPIYFAMRLYGIENFLFKIVCTCDTLDDLNRKEIEYISADNTCCPNGYNIAKGGDNYEKTDQHKQKIGNALRGKKKSPEHIEKMKASRKGQKRGPFTEEHKKKISLAHIGKKKPQTIESIKKRTSANIGRKHTPETIEKFRNARKLFWERKKNMDSIT